jgi:hypothetical protein
MRSEVGLGESLRGVEALGGMVMASGEEGRPGVFPAVDRSQGRCAAEPLRLMLRRSLAALIWQGREQKVFGRGPRRGASANSVWQFRTRA